jgi:hypothetical protein
MNLLKMRINIGMQFVKILFINFEISDYESSFFKSALKLFWKSFNAKSKTKHSNTVNNQVKAERIRPFSTVKNDKLI